MPGPNHPFVLALTGASGAPYGVRLLHALLALGKEVHLLISPAAAQVLKTELDLAVDLTAFAPDQLLPDAAALAPDHLLRGLLRPVATAGVAADLGELRRRMRYFHYMDFSAGAASGSHLTAGMVICPCSMGTLAGIAHGLSTNLIQRAADVHLKERRRLILVPRETPLGLVQLENMRRCAEAGAVVLPAMPPFYHRPRSIADMVDFIVGRICDQLGIEHKLLKRWGDA